MIFFNKFFKLCFIKENFLFLTLVKFIFKSAFWQNEK